MKLRELKEVLSGIPDECNEMEVYFGSNDFEGFHSIDGALAGVFEDDDLQEGIPKEFVALWHGDPNENELFNGMD